MSKEIEKKRGKAGKVVLMSTVAAATTLTSLPFGELGEIRAEASSVFAGGSGTAALR